jgi:hypothetical protein
MAELLLEKDPGQSRSPPTSHREDRPRNGGAQPHLRKGRRAGTSFRVFLHTLVHGLVIFIILVAGMALVVFTLMPALLAAVPLLLLGLWPILLVGLGAMLMEGMQALEKA